MLCPAVQQPVYQLSSLRSYPLLLGGFNGNDEVCFVAELLGFLICGRVPEVDERFHRAESLHRDPTLIGKLAFEDLQCAATDLPGAKQLRAREFDAMWRIAARVPLRQVTPHREPAHLSKVCEVILDDCQQVIQS